MRPTWLILGLILAAGTLAYVNLRERAREAEATPSEPAAPPAPGVRLSRETDAPVAPATPAAPSAEATELERRAVECLQEMSAAHERRDREAYERGLAALRRDAWDAPSARRFAVRQGLGQLEDARRLEGVARVRALDQARRLISRGVFHPDLFDAGGRDKPERAGILTALTAANNEIMTFGRRAGGGLEGVTRVYDVPPGWAPVQIVSREKLPYGHNALLYWNHRGDLDPRKLRAGETLLLPEETLRLEVHLGLKRLAIYIGDWYVKEFVVGVGREDKPSPVGTFRIGPKQENPDWWVNGKVIPAGHPENELGAVWMPIINESYPQSAGFGIHGTNKPETLGTRCSNGCVRLLDAEARELFHWARTGSAGGEATIVVIHSE
jgi:lipoprotein-anchoring transpeptidase ErfK/SrfK